MMISSAWICSSKLKPVIPNPQATEKRKNYFNAVGATGSNRTLFAYFFVARSMAPLPRVEFKAFL